MPNAVIVPLPQSARDLIAEYFGVGIPLRPNETTVTVGTSVVGVGKFARQRVAISFANNGTAAIYLGFNAAIATNQGFQLGAGNFLSFNWFNDGELVMQDFFAISGSASQSLYVVESVLTGNT